MIQLLKIEIFKISKDQEHISHLLLLLDHYSYSNSIKIWGKEYVG
jgi:hypothetical protein